MLPKSMPSADFRMSDANLELIGGRPLDYLVRTPSVRSKAPAALLCFLHGYGEAAPANIFDALTQHGPLNPQQRPRQVEQFVIVAPQLPVAGDSWLRYAAALRMIVLDEVRQRHCDPQRIYLTGFSFGGNGVFDLALGEPSMWAALWSVDPTRVPPARIDIPTWLSIGECSRHEAPAFIQALGLEGADTETAGDRLWSDPGQDHVGTATQAYRDGRIFEWLLSKRR